MPLLWSLQDAKAAGVAFGATINDVITAAVAQALTELLLEEGERIDQVSSLNRVHRRKLICARRHTLPRLLHMAPLHSFVHDLLH